MTTFFAVAIHAASFAGTVMCDRGAPQPASFHSRGFSYVAEVFPAKARRNTDDKPRIYVYEVGYPGANWIVDARRLWTAQLPVMPQAAIVSMSGSVVTLDEHFQAGGDNALVVLGAGGRLARSFALSALLDSADLERVEWSDCGRLWRNGAAFYFSRSPNERLYVGFPWGRVLEIDLASGNLRRGRVEDFATLVAITSQKYPNELTEVWMTSLRFSSITDMISRD